jgi:uncharacterized membrane protein
MAQQRGRVALFPFHLFVIVVVIVVVVVVVVVVLLLLLLFGQRVRASVTKESERGRQRSLSPHS